MSSITPCGVYEEAHEHNGEKLGYGEKGEEFDEEANRFGILFHKGTVFKTEFPNSYIFMFSLGCDFYEECCGEGCVYGEIGQEECY